MQGLFKHARVHKFYFPVILSENLLVCQQKPKQKKQKTCGPNQKSNKIKCQDDSYAAAGNLKFTLKQEVGNPLHPPSPILRPSILKIVLFQWKYN